MFNDLTLIEERKFESIVQSTRVLSIVIVTDNNVVRRIHQVCSEKNELVMSWVHFKEVQIGFQRK